MNLSFQDKGYIMWLAGAVILILFFIWLLRWKKMTARRIGDPSLVAGLLSTHSPRKFLLKFIMVILAFSAGVMALMNLRSPGKTGGKTQVGIDAVIALDISRSMLAQDLAPSRLERAKQFIGKLLDQMPNDRVALVLFAGRAYLQMPLTADHAAARLYVNGAAPESIPQQGTVITDALDRCAKAFPEQSDAYKAVVLITDGEGHDGGAVALARQLTHHGVMINAVGIGSPEGSVIPDAATGLPRKDAEGNTIVSKLNEDLLKDIASVTHGVYVRLQQTDEAAGIVKKQLSQIGSKAYPDESRMNFRRYFPWLAGLMLLLLVGELFVSEKRKPVVA